MIIKRETNYQHRIIHFIHIYCVISRITKNTAVFILDEIASGDTARAVYSQIVSLCLTDKIIRGKKIKNEFRCFVSHPRFASDKK